jgi:hypothetical protein
MYIDKCGLGVSGRILFLTLFGGEVYYVFHFSLDPSYGDGGMVEELKCGSRATLALRTETMCHNRQQT